MCSVQPLPYAVITFCWLQILLIYSQSHTGPWLVALGKWKGGGFACIWAEQAWAMSSGQEFKSQRGNFHSGLVVNTWPSSAEGVGSILGRGTKIPCASWPKNQNIQQKQYYNKFNKNFYNGPHKKKKIFKKTKKSKRVQERVSLSYWGKLSTCHQQWEDNVSHLSQTFKPRVTVPEGWRTQITKFKCNFRISCLLSKFPRRSPGNQSTWKQNKTKCNICMSVWRVHCANFFEKPRLLVISATVERWALTAQNCVYGSSEHGFQNAFPVPEGPIWHSGHITASMHQIKPWHGNQGGGA